jgi:cytochrome d ubiquinol oxidase subunit I
VGAWISGYFIIATNAWMQHPVGYKIAADGRILLDSFSQLLSNPWIVWQYLHNMIATVVTASFVMASIGAYYLLSGRFVEQGRVFLRVGVGAGTLAIIAMVFPTGDGQGKMVAHYQPITLAAMEGMFETSSGAGIALVGQPDAEQRKLDNPMVVPGVLSLLTYKRWGAEIKGLNDFPREQWPDNIPLLYYSYHVMVGIGTLLLALAALCSWALWKGRLFTNRALLWALMLALPFPYIATSAGWMTAEIGRQPWLIYGLVRTAQGYSPHVSAGNSLFTLIGFTGLYMILGLLFLFLVSRRINRGPDAMPVFSGGVLQ